MTPRSDTWMISSGTSKHMIGQNTTLSNFEERDSPQKVSLGYDYQYPINGIGEATYNIDSGTYMKIKDVLYVPRLKNNLLSISSLYNKWFRIAFIDGEFLMWPGGKSLEGGMY